MPTGLVAGSSCGMLRAQDIPLLWLNRLFCTLVLDLQNVLCGDRHLPGGACPWAYLWHWSARGALMCIIMLILRKVGSSACMTHAVLISCSSQLVHRPSCLSRSVFSDPYMLTLNIIWLLRESGQLQT